MIHTEIDLGSLGPDLGRRGEVISGEKGWADHRETVVKFWDAVSGFFKSVDVEGMKLYQDGVLAGGEMGMSVVNKVAADGSRNFQLLLELIEKGAKLMKTESEDFLITEYQRILDLSKAESFYGKSKALIRYRLGKKELTRKRDAYIAQTIAGTLEEGESGVLFMGAYHEVVKELPHDITVFSLKDRYKLLEYIRNVAIGKDSKNYRDLEEYVAAPIILQAAETENMRQ